MQHGTRIGRVLGVIAVAAAAAGCLPSISDLDHGPLTNTFAVSDVFSPSGFMGDGEDFGSLTLQTNEGCKEPRPPNAQGNCYVFTYYPNSIPGQDPWAGAFWVFPSNSWGSYPGHAIDMTKFNQVRYYMAIEGPTPYTVNGMTVPINGLVGGINAHGMYAEEMEHEYRDGVGIQIGPTIDKDVTATLQQFHIPLTPFAKEFGCVDPAADPFIPANCTNVPDPMNPGSTVPIADTLIAAFGWSTHYPNDAVQCKDGTTACQSTAKNQADQFLNPAPVKIYLDDIVWDTAPAPATP